MPKRSAIPASGHASAILVPLLLGLRDGRAGSWFFRLGGRGRSRQMSDDLLGDQLVAGGGEMDAVDAAQTLRHPNAILAIGRVLSVLVGDDGPQRHELKPMPRDRLGIKLVDVAHVVAVALAARDRVAEPQHPQPGGGETVENPVDSRGVLGAPLLAAEAQRRAALAHVDAVVGPEHHDGDIGLLARREGLDRRQPLLLVMHQRGAGMGAIEYAKAGVLGQHALQAAREAGRLAVAEYDDSRRGLLVLRRGLPLALCLALCLALGMRVRPRKPEEHDKQPGAPGSARAAKTANPP